MANNKLTVNDVKVYINNFIAEVVRNLNVDNMKKIYNAFKGFKIYLDKKLYEDKFKYNNLPRFKRGDIIYVDLGETLGSELYKVRPAIVIENDNKKTDRTIVIIPIKTSNNNGKKENIDGLIDVGSNQRLNDKSYVDLKQIKTISKMRIKNLQEIKYLKEKGYKGFILGRLSNEHLDKIDDEMIKLFTKKNVVEKEDV
ncbi:type II toxin-antitoxin system PemK/MazF family toxin [Marinitoga sp. 38H-ov]|jgi:mRNA interferase MazF|uniref:type II toxin-antitoxin system PemK/MazF family toxin n=1 Tax=Marinitoga sp. 38H-ov TaxID=1755814 RepID=UPI0013ED4D3E|nr:type II toxin-antitoxin system PemK/MazF family toxin [Marinitoga sp. 38H-ov]KAF2955847.1 hypothetical protein AS160_08825 [Marinitoga sp. 38H-ov]